MLHIILLILKIIGFLILGILALLLLLTAVFLLAPFVYRAEFSADDSPESIKGSIRFHWLTHLISGYASYEDGTVTWHIRAAWKKFGSEEDTGAKSPPERPEDSGHAGQSRESRREQPAADGAGREVREIKTDNIIADTPKKNAAPPDPVQKPAEDTEKDLADIDLKRPSHTEEQRSGQKEQKSAGWKPFKEKISALYERLKKIPEKIKYTFRKICDKIRTLEKKKERILAFLQNEIHKNAFSRLIREVRRLFHFLRPSKASVDLEFGFADPAYTGYTLAGISLIYPLIGEHAQIKPDFEHKVLRGSIFVKGKIRVLYALIFAWNMFLDKNVRTTYRHIRRFRL